MGDFLLQREINGLMGDLNMNKMAVNSVQNEMDAQLKGQMGEDMRAVLNGERFVKAGVIEKGKFKAKSWLKRFLRMF